MRDGGIFPDAQAAQARATATATDAAGSTSAILDQIRVDRPGQERP